MLYEHLMPCPEDYAYPYPFFIQVMFAAGSLNTIKPHSDDEWVESAEYMDISTVRPMLPEGQRALLDAARMIMQP